MNSPRPFWHELRVHLHPDGISVAARDERPSIAALPTQRRPSGRENRAWDLVDQIAQSSAV